MSKAVRVPEPVYEKLSQVCTEQDLSMAEAASLLIDAELSEDTVLMTEQELERLQELARDAASDAAISGYRNGLLESVQNADSGVVTIDVDGHQLLVGDYDSDRFWETVLDATEQYRSEQDR